jgi:hypothetical protein
MVDIATAQPTYLVENKIQYLFFTFVTVGTDVPQGWIEGLDAYFAQHAEGYLLVTERGVKDRHLHVHAVATMRLADTKNARMRCLKDIKAFLHVDGIGSKVKFQVKVAESKAHHTRTLRYICKDAAQPWFTHRTNYATEMMITQWCGEYGKPTCASENSRVSDYVSRITRAMAFRRDAKYDPWSVPVWVGVGYCFGDWQKAILSDVPRGSPHA